MSALRAVAIFECLNRRELERLGSLLAEDVIDEVLPVGTFRGRRAVVDFFRSLVASFPDWRVDIESTLGDGDRVCVQWRVSGSFTGQPFLGLHANGKSTSVRGLDMMQFNGGLLARNTVYYDGAALARGLGVLPPPGSRRETMMTAAFNMGARVQRVAAGLPSFR